MHPALRRLGLDGNADERAVKRAYARQLREHRPDSDPEGFQQLHETYQAALQWCRSRQQLPADDTPALNSADEADCATVTALDPDTLHDIPACDATDRGTPADTLPPADIETVAVSDADDADQLSPADPVDTSLLPAADSQPAPLPLTETIPPTPLPAQLDVPAAQVERVVATRVDLDAFRQALLAQAQSTDATAFAHWLGARPELWSLSHKPRIGGFLLDWLIEERPAFSQAHFDALVEFFAWDQLGSDVDPFFLRELGDDLHRRWLVTPEGEGTLTHILVTQAKVAKNVPQARHYLALLARPFRLLPALFSALPPGKPTRMLRMLLALGFHPDGQLPAPIQPMQASFWFMAAQRGEANRYRFMLGLLRSVVLGALLGSATIKIALRSEDALGWPWQVFVGIVGLWLGWYTISSLAHWQGAPERIAPRWRNALRLLFLPSLAIVSVLVMQAGGVRPVGTSLAVVALALAVTRFKRRAGITLRFNAWLLLAIWPFAKLAALALLFGEVAAVLALMLWVIDLFKQREAIATALRG